MGQKLLMLEAMKMENNIEADKAGKVVSIMKTQGRQRNGRRRANHNRRIKTWAAFSNLLIEHIAPIPPFHSFCNLTVGHLVMICVG
jgi:hypothetical protein